MGQTLLEAALDDYAPTGRRILNLQSTEGAIPWFENGPWDPWNHVESAMALTALNERTAAAAAFDYLAENQRADGAWFGAYGNALPMVDRDFISREPAPAFLDSNFCAYPAVGVAHYYLKTGDLDRVQAWWPMVERSLDFVLSLQRGDGTISWSQEAAGTDVDDALSSGNASIAKSLECGLYLSRLFNRTKPDWHAARTALIAALRDHPDRFNRRQTGGRHAMDWYYPVLAGVLPPAEALDRLQADWHTFMMPEGCRCVSDEPWVTVAETCELVMALLSANQPDRALATFHLIRDHRDETGAFWMGWQTEEQIIWPKEQPGWTQAAVILAADALFNQDRASQLLVRPLS